jgi:hypothetical protein
MNLGDIEAGLYDVLGFQTTPDSSVTRKLRREINLCHRQILAMRGMSKMRRAILPFTCTSGAPLVALPQAATRIVLIVDRTNRRPLNPISLQELRGRDPGRIYSATIPDAYCIINVAAAVAQDPSVASQLYVISDSASDTGGTTATVEGTVTGGYPRRASIGLNGLTGVAVDSSAAWEHITKFFLSSAAQGNVTLRQTSGVGTELARISEQRTYARYTQIELQGIPGSAITYYADVELHIEDMLARGDEPLLPEDYHYLLECGSLRREYQKREKFQLWKIEDDRWKTGIRDLATFLARSGGIPALTPAGFSQLGWAYPAGS